MTDDTTKKNTVLRNPRPEERLRCAPPSDPAFVGAFVGGPPQLTPEELKRLSEISPERVAKLRDWWDKNRERLLAELDEDTEEEAQITSNG